MIVIDHERYGVRTEFNTIDEAQAGIRQCGGELEGATVHVSLNVVRDDRGDVVGYVDCDCPLCRMMAEG